MNTASTPPSGARPARTTTTTAALSVSWTTGMDQLALKARYGDKLAFHGGLNALKYEHPEEMWSEMERVIPTMKANGGYVIGTDHSVPDNVSLDSYREFIARARQLGRYD